MGLRAYQGGLSFVLPLLPLVLFACAGSSPLLHPAHPLPEGEVRFGAGTALSLATGEISKSINEAKSSIPNNASQPSEAFVRGALASAAISPGVSPFLSARIGVGYDGEAGLAYTGRTARADGRWVLHDDSYALSLGLGGSILLGQRQSIAENSIAGLNAGELKGWGLDVPILVGWRSSADLLWLWMGARAGYEKLSGTLTFTSPAVPGSSEVPVAGDVDARRLFAGALTGFAIGFRHLHAAFELQATYQQAKGSIWNFDSKVDGLCLTPAAALLGSF